MAYLRAQLRLQMAYVSAINAQKMFRAWVGLKVDKCANLSLEQSGFLITFTKKNFLHEIPRSSIFRGTVAHSVSKYVQYLLHVTFQKKKFVVKPSFARENIYVSETCTHKIL